jgi:hypothetical protein
MPAAVAAKVEAWCTCDCVLQVDDAVVTVVLPVAMG